MPDATEPIVIGVSVSLVHRPFQSVLLAVQHDDHPDSDCWLAIESEGTKIDLGPFDRVELLQALQSLHRGLSEI